VTQKLGGRYELHEELAQRGDTRVYRASDTELHRDVLLRVIPTSTSDLEHFIRFQEEGVVLATLDHPNIWKVHGTFIDGGLLCIVAEFEEGSTLTAILQAGALPLGRAKRIALQLTSALMHAHGRGVIHRDLNPDHIVIGSADHVKLRDLNEQGIARLVRGGPASAALTQVISPYMAPEQIRGIPVDARTDIFSLGAVLYHMLAGSPPKRDILEFDGTPSGWRVVIAKAMAANRRYRYQTVQEMDEAIRPLPPKDAIPDIPEVTVEGKRCPKCGWRGDRQFCGACGTRLVEA
jgi:serine/threonine protein kinase